MKIVSRLLSAFTGRFETLKSHNPAGSAPLILAAALFLFLQACPLAAASEEFLLKARELEERASNKTELTEAMRQYQKVFASARTENNEEMAASALFSIAQIWSARFSDSIRAKKYLTRIIQDFPGSSWAQRATEMMESGGSGDGSGASASGGKKMVKGYAFDLEPVQKVHDRQLGLKVLSPGDSWVMTSGRSKEGLYVFAAPRRSMENRYDENDPVPNISLYAAVMDSEIEIISYVNAHQEVALKQALANYKLLSQDVMMLSGKVSVQKTFRFSREGLTYRGMQFYSARGKLMVVTTYMAPDSLFSDYIRDVKSFVEALVF